MSKLNNPKALVLCGDGVNCENETAYALQLAGAEATILHVNKLLQDPLQLLNYQILALPGGFSFGDEVSSGKLLAIKLQHQLKDVLKQFVAEQRIVIGICNGFQALVKLGILPDSLAFMPQVTLIHNRQHQFMNRWVRLNAALEHPFFKGLDGNSGFELPIRHGEGRLVIDEQKVPEEVFKKAKALVYTHDVNGAYENTAALVSTNGNVLGMMPHPEAFIRWSQHYDIDSQNTGEKPPGLKLFENIVEVAKTL